MEIPRRTATRISAITEPGRLIHNDALNDLQRFILHAMLALESKRQTLRHPSGKRTERGQSRFTESQGLTGVTDTLERLARQVNGEVGDELRRAAERVRVQVATQETVQRRMLDGYSSLAALGHTASLLGRSMNMGIAGLRERVTSLRGSARHEERAEQCRIHGHKRRRAGKGRCWSRCRGSSAGHLGRIRANAKRRRGLDVPVELHRIREGLQQVLEQEDAELEVQTQDGVLRTEMRPEMFASIINLMVRNSLEWRVAGRPLRMIVVLRENGDSV